MSRPLFGRFFLTISLSLFAIAAAAQPTPSTALLVLSKQDHTLAIVDPATLPAGPFLAYDHQGNLVSSIYMIPLKDMNAQKAFSSLKVARERADHVDIVFNAGHPGVAEPHYHVIVWYVSPQRAAQLAK